MSYSVTAPRAIFPCLGHSTEVLEIGARRLRCQLFDDAHKSVGVSAGTAALGCGGAVAQDGGWRGYANARGARWRVAWVRQRMWRWRGAGCVAKLDVYVYVVH
ncbi:uncharacterized protein LOC105423544 [Pogonomyrmex barbatus]|uniref:Uncharacterized protein LOC105423544 n=1 Tax=Pogonomyrmex barbatus TaxID=144034 RepID=A0A6I9VZZ2_9HYME|nr:uncharacterized protein LOC105423544 [Pogonomyrmex barbatus]